MLTDPAALRAWLAEHGMEPVAAVTTADVETARSLREALHRAAAATLNGQPPAAPTCGSCRTRWPRISPWGSAALRRGSRWTGPPMPPVALAWLARQAAVDLTGPTRERLHACGDDTCSGIFIDHTGRRRWCSDERCGVRARVRAHRARARTAD